MTEGAKEPLGLAGEAEGRAGGATGGLEAGIAETIGGTLWPDAGADFTAGPADVTGLGAGTAEVTRGAVGATGLEESTVGDIGSEGEGFTDGVVGANGLGVDTPGATGSKPGVSHWEIEATQLDTGTTGSTEGAVGRPGLEAGAAGDTGPEVGAGPTGGAADARGLGAETPGDTGRATGAKSRVSCWEIDATGLDTGTGGATGLEADTVRVVEQVTGPGACAKGEPSFTGGIAVASGFASDPSETIGGTMGLDIGAKAGLTC